MRITDAKEQIGGEIARPATVNRSAYHNPYAPIADLAGVGLEATKQFHGLQQAEEDAKSKELQTEYEIEYQTKVNELDTDHKQNNLDATEYGKRHEQIISDLSAKYSSAYDFKTQYGKEFSSFVDLNGRAKAAKFTRNINDVAAQNQSISWARGELNRQKAAVGGDYEMLQQMIAEQTAVYESAPFLVAHGAGAVEAKQNFIDTSSKKWAKTQLANGSSPYDMIKNIDNGTLFSEIGPDARTDIKLTLTSEIKRRDTAAKSAAKANQVSQLAQLYANGIRNVGAMDPKSKEHKKAFTHIMNEELSNIDDPSHRLQKAREVRKEYGFIEKGEVSSITAMFNSGDEVMMQTAIQSVDDYVKDRPAMSQYFNKDILHVRDLVSSGYSVATATEMFKQSAAMPEERKMALSELLKDKDAVKEHVDDIAEKFEEYWDVDSFMGFGGWDRPEQLNTVAEKVYKEHYMLYNGNEKAAVAGTTRFLASNYGVTSIGPEKRLMFQAPATYLKMRTNGKEVEPEEIKKEFVKEMVEFGVPEESAKNAEIYRAPSDDSKGNPQYTVLMSGQPLLNKKGNVQKWTFDPNNIMNAMESETHSEVDEEKKDTIKKIDRGDGGFRPDYPHKR